MWRLPRFFDDTSREANVARSEPLRVVVVGAGVSGLAAAWSLHRAGHQVTIVERAPDFTCTKEGPQPDTVPTVWVKEALTELDLWPEVEPITRRQSASCAVSWGDAQGLGTLQLDSRSTPDSHFEVVISKLRQLLFVLLKQRLGEDAFHFGVEVETFSCSVPKIDNAASVEEVCVRARRTAKQRWKAEFGFDTEDSQAGQAQEATAGREEEEEEEEEEEAEPTGQQQQEQQQQQPLAGEAGGLEATTREQEAAEVDAVETFRCDLLVGADGVASAVRRTLAKRYGISEATETAMPIAAPEAAPRICVRGQAFDLHQLAPVLLEESRSRRMNAFVDSQGTTLRLHFNKGRIIWTLSVNTHCPLRRAALQAEQAAEVKKAVLEYVTDHAWHECFYNLVAESPERWIRADTCWMPPSGNWAMKKVLHGGILGAFVHPQDRAEISRCRGLLLRKAAELAAAAAAAARKSEAASAPGLGDAQTVDVESSSSAATAPVAQTEGVATSSAATPPVAQTDSVATSSAATPPTDDSGVHQQQPTSKEDIGGGPAQAGDSAGEAGQPPVEKAAALRARARPPPKPREAAKEPQLNEVSMRCKVDCFRLKAFFIASLAALLAVGVSMSALSSTPPALLTMRQAGLTMLGMLLCITTMFVLASFVIGRPFRHSLNISAKCHMPPQRIVLLGAAAHAGAEELGPLGGLHVLFDVKELADCLNEHRAVSDAVAAFHRVAAVRAEERRRSIMQAGTLERHLGVLASNAVPFLKLCNPDTFVVTLNPWAITCKVHNITSLLLAAARQIFGCIILVFILYHCMQAPEIAHSGERPPVKL
eukprot:TRINITY_DN13762_c0_g3_i2.p1 TRINITY_DN13762_c0_g3~~TRINITY_DN13762_c0_g3_i2.p1  ORF type:complete len:822 (-),score=201.24 TRINITY_DN13762_c0_g3_i2:54-2519(-)